MNIFEFYKSRGFEEKKFSFLIKTVRLKKKMFHIKIFLLNVSFIANRAIFNFEFLICRVAI